VKLRVLQVIWAGGGNVPPQLGIARRLVERGHEVRVLGPRALETRIEATGARFVGQTHAPEGDSSRRETDLIRDWEARTPIGAFARARDNVIYGPASRFARDVVAELEREPADLVAADYFLNGALVGAEAAGVPAVALVHTIYPLPAPGVPPFGMGLRPARGRLGATRDAILTRIFRGAFAPGLRSLNEARRELGLKPLGDAFGQLDRVAAVLVLTSPAFDFASRAALPAQVRYVGPVLDEAGPAAWTSPWPADHPDPLVVASFSSTFQDQRDLARRVLEALGELPVRGLLTAGPAIDVSGLDAPANVEVREFVPHGAVLPEASLVISHGGLGTVHAALAAAVPLVCLPHGRDQDDNAVRVAAAGAGVRLSRRSSARRLASAIEAALGDPSLRAGAARLAEAFAREDGAGRAVEELEALAG
jgi:MGT family glycosyltransferase